jgi:hypothetical protein
LVPSGSAAKAGTAISAVASAEMNERRMEILLSNMGKN